MKTVSSPVRLGDGRLLRHKRKNALGHDEWHAANGLRVLVSAEQYSNHVSVSCMGRAPAAGDVELVRAVFFDGDAKVSQGPVANTGVVHLIEMRQRQ